MLTAIDLGWGFYAGEGKTAEEAKSNLKLLGNCYSPPVAKEIKRIESYKTVKVNGRKR